MFKSLALAALLAVFAGTFAISGGVARAAATWYVAPLPPGSGTAGGSCAVPSTNTIQAAVNAASPGDTIQVCPGTYAENVNVSKTLTLLGAQANVPVAGRTSSNPAESRVTSAVGSPVFAINAISVTINGFSISETTQAFAASGITVNAGGTGAVIKNNIFDGISTADTGSNGTAQAIYLQNGPDGVQILANRMENISSNRSAKGVLLGDNGATNAPDNTTVQDNVIRNVSSTTRGAYGVSVANITGGTAGLNISNNSISNLNGGGWVHAIGLEGNTPSVNVAGNNISNLVATGPDVIAVWFESNPGFSTAAVNGNNFNLPASQFGIAVQPTIPGTGTVNGTCNWWGAPNGPSGAGTGSGAQVSPRVTYQPWLIAPSGSCIGGNLATDKDQCKNDGWMTRTRADGSPFKNQGDCVSYTNTGR